MKNCRTQNSQQRVLGVSIAYVPGNDRHVVQIAVPLGVSIAKGAVIKTDCLYLATLPFRRCDRGGCYVELLLPQRHDRLPGQVRPGGVGEYRRR